MGLAEGGAKKKGGPPIPRGPGDKATLVSGFWTCLGRGRGAGATRNKPRSFSRGARKTRLCLRPERIGETFPPLRGGGAAPPPQKAKKENGAPPAAVMGIGQFPKKKCSGRGDKGAPFLPLSGRKKLPKRLRSKGDDHVLGLPPVSRPGRSRPSKLSNFWGRYSLSRQQSIPACCFRSFHPPFLGRVAFFLAIQSRSAFSGGRREKK